MPKVLLVNPPPLAVLEPWYDAPEFGRLALASLAGYLRAARPRVELKLIDAKLERLSFAEVAARAAAWEPDLVGLTAFTNEIKPAAYQAALIKRAAPRAITVIGGVHVTALPQQTLAEFPSFDLGVVGEGEATLTELCAALESGGELAGVRGLVWRRDGAPVLGPARERELELDRLPMPAWDLLPRAETYWIQSQRGCPYDCVFCMNPNGRAARAHSPARVVAEMKLIVERWAPRQIRFGDEIFSLDRSRTVAVLEGILAQGLEKSVGWVAQTHVRCVDRELLALMKRAGAARVEMGVETGEEAALKTMGKGTNLPMIRRAFEAAREAGATTGAFFLLGQPNETEATIAETVDLASALNPDLPMFGVMTPYPGTEVAELAAKGEAGYKLLSVDWDDYNKHIGGALEFGGLSRARIEWLQLKAYFAVFLRNGRWLDLGRFAWEYRGGVWKVLEKLARRSASVAGVVRPPTDYARVLSSGRPAALADIAAARASWSALQRAELSRARLGGVGTA